MNVTFSCPECQQIYQTTITAAYFSFRCHKCHTVIKVPDKSNLSSIIIVDPRDIICENVPKEGGIKCYGSRTHSPQSSYYSYSDGYCQ